MKLVANIFLSLSLVTLITGCASKDPTQAPIAETYIHKYGVEVARDDWEARGKHGQIVSQRKDGVVVCRNYMHGLLEGQSTFTFSHSDMIAHIETYDKGRLVSEKHHYANGNPMLETTYATTGERSLVSWYQDGTPRFGEVFRGDKLLTAQYLTAQGEIEGTVAKGSGARIIRDEEGQLVSEDRIAKGEMTARATFFANGDPETITPFAHRQVHGQKQTFLVGGIPHTVETWTNGELHGTVTSFANGEKKAEVPYDHGHRHGVELRYGPKGSVVEEITWIQDRRHGPDVFHLNSELKTDWYHHGQQVSKAVYERLNPQQAA